MNKLSRILKKLSKKIIFIVSALLVASAGIFFYAYLTSKSAAAWFDENWLYRAAIPISSHTASENNVYITVTVDTSTPITAGKMQSDCGDLRFTKENGELLPYFINASPGCNNASTTVQVNFDTFPAGAQTIYYYYGNPSAPNGFNSAAFSTEATSYALGSVGSETQGPGPVAYWKFDEGYGTTAYTSMPTTTASTVSVDTGTGGDGACTVSADTNINTASCAGRGTADAVNFSSTANTSAGATAIVLTATSTGLATSDEVLIINLQGTSGDNSNVGKYETKTISSITTTTVSNDTLNFATGLTNAYDGTTQKIMVQRVPNYTSVTVDNTKTLTVTAWNGTKGGVIFFRANGTVTVSGTIDMGGKGFRGGAIMSNGGGCEPDSDGQGYGGETYNGYAFRGTGVGTDTPNTTGGAGGGQNTTWDVKSTTGNTGGGGGGGGWTYGWAGGYGGGGGYGTVGQGLNPGNGTLGGNTTSGNKAAGGGGTYGGSSLSSLMFGSGGGGGDVSGGQGPCPGGVGTTFGGYGGGIITINGDTITVNSGGLIKANGQNTTWGGGGAGGSVKLVASTLTLGTNLVTTTGGTSNGYVGGSGRIAISGNSISGTTTPTYYDAAAITLNGTLAGSTTPAWTAEDQCVSSKCLYFNGSTASVTVSGTASSIKTISFWVKPKTNGEKLIDLDGGTHYISASSGTISATGFTSPTIYVNGKVSSTLTANTWQHITVTTGTAFNASAITMGKVSSTYLNGYLDDVKIYNYARSAAQIKTDYLAGKSNAGTKQGDSAVLGSKPEDWLSNGLVGYWKMDEAAANSCTGASNDSCDSSGNGNDGAWSGNTTVGTGKFGNGVSMDGTGDFTTISDPGTSVLDITGQITMSAWVKTSGTNDYTGIIFKNTGYTGYQMSFNTSGGVRADLYNGSTYITPANSTNVENGSWHLVTTTYDGATAKIYVDGVVGTNATGTGFLTANNASMLIGRDSCCGGGRDLNGTIDDVRIYNRALSPKEVSDLYNWAPGPKVNLKMEEGSGTSANDSSGNSNNGTVNSGTWTTGKYGKGVNVNGTSGSNVSVPDFTY
ncbi:MAG: DUF2341 domain-containing protein [bacterium]|nr:DUF2341 domain-containing protein [bacterium]